MFYIVVGACPKYLPGDPTTRLPGVTRGRGVIYFRGSVTIVHTILCELDIEAKLLSITSDNASNNSAMAEILYDMLKADYDTEILSQGNTQSIMRYQEKLSFVRCLAHILNLIVKEFLAILKASDIAGDQKIVEDLQNNLIII